MKKAFVATLALIAAALMLTTTAASAKDVDGKFGVGFNQSLTGTASGLAANYWAGNFKIGGMINFDMFAPKDGDSQMGLQFGLQGLYAIARAQNVNLNLGLRVLIGFENEAKAGADSRTGFSIEVPIEVEYWFDDHFSITGHTGLVVDIIGEKGSPLAAGGQGTRFALGTGGFSGGVGFNFYF